MESKAMANERSNFSVADLEIFREVMDQYKTGLENKKTDALSVNKKDGIWKAITQTFNARATTHRTTKQLKYRWDYIKRIGRKNLGKFNRETRLTGGGPPPAPLSDTDVWVQDVLKESSSGLASIYDGDAAPDISQSLLENEKNILTSGPLNLDAPVTIEYIDMNELEKENITGTEDVAEKVEEEESFIRRLPPSSVTPGAARNKMCMLAEEKTKYVRIKKKILLEKENLVHCNLKRREENEERRVMENHNFQMELMKRRIEMEERRLENEERRNENEERRREELHSLEMRIRESEHQARLNKIMKE